MIMKVKRVFLVPVFLLAASSLAGCDNPLKSLFGKKAEPYKVYWKNSDGSILKIDNAVWLTYPKYSGKTPEKATDDTSVYTFAGWDKEIEMVTGDATYTATYTSSPREYKVHWLNYDNSEISYSNVPYGTVPVYEGAEPTRNPETIGNTDYEYEFAGWDRPLTAVTGEASYKATYRSKTFSRYSISYQFNPVTHTVVNPNATQLRAGETLTLQGASCAGYDFVGWFLDANRTKPVTSIPNINESVTLYGQFDIHTYSITYNVNGGDEGTFGPSTITCLDEADLLETSKVGYDFVTWRDQHGTALTKLSDVCEDLTLTANFNAKSFTITLRYSEKNDEYVTIRYDEKVQQKLPKLTKNGYNFLGWFYEDDPDQICDLDTYNLLRDITLIQKWSDPIDYTITYTLDGGTNPDNAPEQFSAVNQPELPVPTKEGYDFLGWYEGNSKVESLRRIFRDLELTARWEAKDVQLSFDYDGGSLQRVVKFYDDTSVVATEYISPSESVEFKVLADKERSQFNGWLNEMGQREAFTSNKTVDADLNLRAQWVSVRADAFGAKINEDASFAVQGFNNQVYQYTSLVQQTVKFESTGAFDLKAELQNSGGSVLSRNDDISQDNKNFSITYNLAANTTYYLKVSSMSESNGTATITATSTATDLTPKGVINAAEYVITSSTQKFDELFASVGSPVKEGKVFDGWVDEDNNKYEASTQLKKLEINLKATWIDA